MLSKSLWGGAKSRASHYPLETEPRLLLYGLIDNIRTRVKGRMKISNIIATVALKNPFDLGYIARYIENTQVLPKVPWIKYRLARNNSYIAFYRSGKVLVTAKSFDQLNENARAVLTKLEDIGIIIEGWKLEIHNIVVVDKVDLKHSLERIICNMDPKKASYEPEQFAGLIYKDWGVSITLFSTGTVIVTGGNNMDVIKHAVSSFQQLIDAA